MILDWHFYYVAAIVNSIADEADVMVVARDHGHELGLDGEATARKREMLDPRVELAIVKGRQSDPTTILSALQVSATVCRFRPDVVHVQDHSDWRLDLVQRLSGAPACLTVHDVVPHLGVRETTNRIQRSVGRRLRREARTVIVHGERLAELAAEQKWLVDRCRLAVIPHGVLAAPVAPIPLPERPTPLFFGRLEAYKGLDLFIAGVEEAARTLPHVKAIIAGRGPEAAACRGLVTRPELFDWREGFVSDGDLPGLFAEASVVCLPYREASQSGVVPIAYANGRAVIATAVGALEEAVHDGIDGILVLPDDVSAFAAALVRFHSEPGLAPRLSDAALAAATTGRLSSAEIARRHLEEYRRMIGGEPA